eukprot:30743-Pyramimonas_sp.AAC.1
MRISRLAPVSPFTAMATFFRKPCGTRVGPACSSNVYSSPPCARSNPPGAPPVTCGHSERSHSRVEGVTEKAKRPNGA